MKLFTDIKNTINLIKQFEKCKKEHLRMLNRHIKILKQIKELAKN